MIPHTKTDQIRAAWAAKFSDRIGALRIAARFFDRSDAIKAFKRGMDAHNHRDFYRQVGKDPELLLSTALELFASLVCEFCRRQLYSGDCGECQLSPAADIG